MKKETPFLNEIELCSQLVAYCTRLIPNQDDAVVVDNVDKSLVANEALKSDEWKNSKAQFMVSKKDDNNDFFVGKKKDKKKKSQNKQEEAKSDNKAQPLQHQIETLRYFEEIKVSPPLTTDKIEDTLKVLNEKKAAFQKMQEEAIKAEEEKAKAKAENPEAENNTEEGAEKKEEEATADKKDSPAKNDKPKKEKSKKPQQIDVANESEFPSM